MSARASKGNKRPSLYSIFADAYRKARPNESHKEHIKGSQAEWNQIKWNEEYVKEKIEEYLEIYNEICAASKRHLGQSTSPKPAKKRKVKHCREEQKNQNENETNQENNENAEEDEENEECDIYLNLNDQDRDDDDDEEEEDGQGKKRKKKSYYKKKRPSTREMLTEKELLEDLNNVSSVAGVAINPLDKKKRQPAQQRVFTELAAINSRIASLVQVRDMGLSTSENTKQLRQLMKDRRKKAFELRRLQCRQRASDKYRVKRRKIVQYLYDTKPELHPQLKKVYRPGGGRPRIEEQIPGLLEAIEEIAKVGGASDDRRRSSVIRPCLTLDDLREKLRQRGIEIKRTTLYYRLLPHRVNTFDGRRHINTVPVRLRRAQRDDHAKHEDGHFATATIRYIKDLASVFGNDCVLYLSQDDKCKVPLGLAAARAQTSMLVHLDYRISLPDHDWVVAPRHQLIPSVYAACLLSKNGDVGYSGPTYVAIRSARHEISTADTHAADFDRLIGLKEFENVARNDKGEVKPIVIVVVDGGPDENPRFPKTLVANVRKFKKYNLDALFVLTHAPGQSAYNIVESRMAPLSRDLAGLVLPHDFYGSHLNESGVTINVDLEKLNFRKAGQTLADRWNQSLIDGFPCVAEYINPPATSDDERRLIDTKIVIDDILRKVCGEEEAEEGHEFRVHASDQYYQENARPRRERVDETLKYDIDEYWCATHVLQTQYTLQIIRCNSIECCGPWRSNYFRVFPHRFLPSPTPFERTMFGIRMADRDHQRGQFYGSLFQRIQCHGVVIQHTQTEMLPFDYCCPSVKKELKKRTCRICNQYIPSAYRMKCHYKIHAQHQEECDEEDEDTLPPLTKSDGDQSTETTSKLKKEILEWLEPDIESADTEKASKEVKNDNVIYSMKNLCVRENKDGHYNIDCIAL